MQDMGNSATSKPARKRAAVDRLVGVLHKSLKQFPTHEREARLHAFETYV